MVQSVFFISLFPMIRWVSILDTIDDRYFPDDRRLLFRRRSTIIISLFHGLAIKFDHSRACSLCYLPANLIPGSLCVQTYEVTLRVTLHARLHIWFVRVDKSVLPGWKCKISALKKEKSANIAQIRTFLSHCTLSAVVPHVIIIIKSYNFTWISLGAH